MVPTISRDTPSLSITSVARDRLPVFRNDAIKAIVCAALDEALRSGSFPLFAYVIMPDHWHIITGGVWKPSDTLRFLNGITAHRVIGYLKEDNYTSSLAKLHRTQRKYAGTNTPSGTAIPMFCC